MDIKKITRAIVSVSDKTGVLELAKALDEAGVEILSTGGTAKLITDAGIAVTKVSDFTGFPEIMDGRVKTLNPKIHGGILMVRSNDDHVAQAEANGIKPIDMVVVNLYPFEQTIAKEGVTDEEAIENIDIGGPCMIRASAKNHADVAVVVDPSDYDGIIASIKEHGGLSHDERRRLATKAYARTSEYDGFITAYLSGGAADKVNLAYDKVADLRYGENPHQTAAFYAKGADTMYTGEQQLHGKELSYNNIVDLDAALQLCREFDEPACVIIKHNNPCGVAIHENLTEAYKNALACDPVSAFGSVIAFNREVDIETANEMAPLFVEAIIAPSFSEEALVKFKKKKNLRLIQPKDFNLKEPNMIKHVVGGVLIQSADDITLIEENLKVVSKRQPTEEELKSAKFAWTVAKHVKSNAIVYARNNMAVGVGAGQMNRRDSAEIAGIKSQFPVEGCVMSSDAFFPFRDGIDLAGKAGITCVIQPGGSVKDDEVIAAADEYDMAMIFTGIRHFRH